MLACLSMRLIPPRHYSPIDEEKEVGAWTMNADILGTQFGPNKNGRRL